MEDPTPAATAVTVDELARQFWRLELAHDPLSATLLGIHDHDDRLGSCSAASEAAHRDRLGEVRDELRANRPDTRPSDPTEVTAALLEHELEWRITALGQRRSELAVDQMTGPHAELLMSAAQLTYPDPVHAEAALRRHEQVPTLLEEAAERFREGLATGRRPAGCVLRRSLHALDGYLATAPAKDPFLAAGLPAGWAGAEQWRTAVQGQVRDVIRPAVAQYTAMLRDELGPLARDDDHAGWCWLPDGESLYRATIAQHTSTTATPEALHELGRSICEEQLPEEFSPLGAELFGTSDPATVFDRLRTDTALRHRDGEEILRTAEQAVHRATELARPAFGRFPATSCVVAPIPDFLADDAPYAYYFPPATDGSRPGTYFINTSDPAGSSRTEAESIAFHEAIPGHHLQLGVAQELDGLAEFRRHVGSTAYIEGWGLYAERLADELGCYSGPLDRIGMLTADSWRSARLVVDTGLHAFGWSRARAISYFEDHTPVPTEQIAVEVDRYLAMPGQALAYKVGQLAIAQQRALARERLGGRFSLPDFHDVVLGSGAVTLPVLGRLVDAWTTSTSP